MLTIHIERFGYGLDSTLGLLTLSGDDPWSCFIVEDEGRLKKVKGETAIPTGYYEVKLRKNSAKFDKYYERFPGVHRGVLHLQDVPDFEYVYFHIGNKERHTEGCLLPNVVPIILPHGEFAGATSETAYLALYKRCMAAYDRMEKVTVEITEREARR